MKFSKKKISIATVSVLIFCVAVFGIYQVMQNNWQFIDMHEQQKAGFDSVNLSSIKVAAQSANGAITLDGAVAISAENISESFVQNYVEFEPHMAYSTRKLNNTTVLVTPDQPLTENSLVTVSLNNDDGDTIKKWAFQTEGVFKIVSNYPSNGSTWVSLDSGIELRFSQNDVDIESLKQAFSITPDCQGSFKAYNQTIVFVPKDGLQADTQYTIDIANTVRDSEGNTIGQALRFSFKTQYEYKENYFYDGNYQLDNYKPDQAPIAKLQVSENAKNKAVDVKVFKFVGFNEFCNELEKSIKDDYKLDFANMEQISEFSAQQQFISQSWNGNTYVMFPESLSQGWYAIEYSIANDDGTLQSMVRFVQISSVSFYSAANSKQAMVWVNDINQNKPISNATVTLIKDSSPYTAKTGLNGVAVIDFPQNQIIDGSVEDFSWQPAYKNVVKVSYNGQNFAAIVSTAHQNITDVQSLYYSYIYTSRELYRPTDTVKVWGVIKQRTADRLPQTVTLTFDKSYGEPMWEKQVQVYNDGTFMAEFAYSDLEDSYCSIQLLVDGQFLNSTSFMVQDFEKPIYTVDVQTDKQVYFADAKGQVEVSIDAKFFEGTPASQLPIKLYTGYVANYNEDIIVDSNGKATTKIKYDLNENSSWQPIDPIITAKTDGNDSTATYASKNVLVFTRNIMMQTEVEYPEANSPIVKVDLNKIQPKGISTTEQLYSQDYPQNIKGEQYNADVNVLVYLGYYQATETGEYYDFIYKKNVKTYSYEYKKDIVKQYQAKPQNGQLVIDNLPPLESGQSYIYELSCKDTAGANVTQTAYAFFGNQQIYYRKELSHEMNFEAENYGQYTDNQDVTVKLQNAYEDFQVEEGGYFVASLVQDKFYDTEIYTTENFTIPYDTKNFPNARVVGAYYQNGSVYEIAQTAINFSPEQRLLNIEVIADKQQYLPGEQAKITLKLTDKNGNPVGNASVCVSISDEAVFYLADQDANFIENLFSGINWDYVQTFTSYKEYALDKMATEGGGEGDGVSVRQQFADDITMLRLTTDGNGLATLDAKLADNLTSWRITVLAITNNLYGADTVYHVQTKLPMFISTTFTDSFLTGDSISFGARTYGQSITGKEIVQYTAIIKNSDGDVVSQKEAKSAAYDDGSFVFEPLDEGIYTLEITAKTGELSDGEIRQFAVSQSNAQIRIRREVLPDEINSIQALKYPLNLLVSNQEYKIYNQIINSLLATPNIRDDERIASEYARKLLCEMTDEIYTQNEIGKISSDDLYFLARMCVMAPEYIEKSLAMSQFDYVLSDINSSSEQVTSAYLGMAAFGEPVLNSIRYLLQNAEGTLKLEDILRLCAAAAIIGDYDTAETYYNKYVSPKLGYLELANGDRLMRLNVAQKETENVECTALASITAFVINHNDRDSLAQYLLYAKENMTGDKEGVFYPVAELSGYLKYFVPKNDQEVILSYAKDGQEITVNVGKSGAEYISFNSAEQYENADILVVSGEPYICAVYTGSIDQADNFKSDVISVKRTSADEAQIGKRTKVTLTVKSDVAGWVLVKDFVPSGFRYDEVNNSYNNLYYLTSGGNKSVTFMLNCEKAGETYTIEYYIHAITKGKFISETPIVCLLNENITGLGERGLVVVK